MLSQNPRELFVPVPIMAISGKHALKAKDGSVKTLGYFTDKIRYTAGGGIVVPAEICFHYGTDHSDFFFFENGTMVYQVSRIETPEFITDVYSECAMMNSISPEDFIKTVVKCYVMTELKKKNWV